MTNLYLDGSESVGGSLVTLAQGANFRNFLIGGDATTNPWQRGTSITNIGATNTYTADRWFMVNGAGSSGQVVKTSDTNTPGFSQSFKWGRGQSSGSVSAITIGQALESNDSIRAQGQQLCLSFTARGDAGFSTGQTASTIGVQVSQGFGTDQSASALVNGTWTSQANVISATQVITATDTRYSFSSSAVSNTATQLGVLLTYTPNNTTAQTAENVIMKGVQLEIGTSPSAFEKRPVEVEVALCQRYFWQLNEPATGVNVGIGMVAGTNVPSFSLPTPVQMRAAPTVTITQGSFGAQVIGGYVAMTSMISGAGGSTVNYIDFSGAATAVSGQACFLTGGSANQGKILASAEL